jgi:4-amino-4-deoxy-L-arabinose transferase-like glycosyltransferase
MVTLQDLIHHLEVGAGMTSFNRTMRWVTGFMAVVLVLVAYDLRAYRNLATQEAMDTAQLGRNLAQGKGYSTLFVRPISIYLLQHRFEELKGTAAGTPSADAARIKGNHPDLANPPVYPMLLAGVMKVLPFRYALTPKLVKQFYRYQPDFLIALVNQVLLLLLGVTTYFLARRLFDAQVAFLSTLVLLGTELLWRFSVSGISTILLMLILMAVVWCLVFFEKEAREPTRGRSALFLLAALAGCLVGVAALTRYSVGWVILPVLGFIVLCAVKTRAELAATTLLGFLLVLTPWIVRNYNLSGMPFGTATLAIIEGSELSREDLLERSLNPEILRPSRNSFPFLTAASRVLWRKLAANSRVIFQSDLPRLGGTWVSGFFLVGLMVRFKSPILGRLRLFLLATLLVLVVTQALGRTKLSDASPDINSENLLVLVCPLIVMYGVSLFFVVLDQVQLPMLQLRSLVTGLFALVACLPLILNILPPKANPIVYPPYYPPSIQTAVGWVKEDELIMSDIPWAVAWYGQSQSISLTLNARFDFFAVNDFLKPVSALYLTPQTVERWTQVGDWGNLFLQTVRVLPGNDSKYPLHLGLTLPQLDAPPIPFPLDYLQKGWPMQLLFTFRQHWPSSP